MNTIGHSQFLLGSLQSFLTFSETSCIKVLHKEKYIMRNNFFSVLKTYFWCLLIYLVSKVFSPNLPYPSLFSHILSLSLSLCLSLSLSRSLSPSLLSISIYYLSISFPPSLYFTEYILGIIKFMIYCRYSKSFNLIIAHIVAIWTLHFKFYF